MREATLPEVRELARRSRTTQRLGIAAIAAALAGIVLTALLGERGALVGVLLAGAMLVAWARAAGQERGAYRALLREMKRREPAGPREDLGPGL